MSSVTKQILARSLENLLSQKTLDKITVQMLVEDCGVNRQTFYYHFHDLYDLLTWMYMEQTEKLLGDDLSAETWRDALLALLRYAQQRRNIILNTYQSVARDRLEQQMAQVVRHLMLPEIGRQSEGLNIDPEDRQFVLDFFSYALVGIILEWIRKDMAEKPDVILHRVGALTGEDIRRMLIKYQR